MILMFLFFVLSALFFIFVLPASGQNIAQFKDVPLGKVVDDQRYVDGNKYSQKENPSAVSGRRASVLSLITESQSALRQAVSQ